MKLVSCAVISTAALLCSPPAFAGQSDLLLKQIAARSPGAKTSWSKAVFVESGRTYVPCLIKSSDPDLTSKAISEVRGFAKIIGGGIISAKIPPEFVDAVVARDEVVLAEAAPRLAPKMNTARAASAVDVVQDGSALGTAYNGKNVVVGVVDNALDYGNEDFKGSDGNTRVQYLLQQADSGNLECTKRTIANGSCEITDGGQGQTHGTHVTGIAAGANSTYTGVAPQSDIMFVFINAGDSDSGGAFATAALEGVQTIFAKADIMDKAAVVNMSLGTSIGAHDGTSLLEEGISTLTGAKGGRILVNAQGNEQVIPAAFPASMRDYIGGIHASIDVADGAAKASRIMVLDGEGATDTYTGGTLVDLWLEPGQKDYCSVAVLGYTQGRATNNFTFPSLASTSDSTLSTTDTPFSSDSSTTITANSVTATIATASSDPRNSKPRAIILLAPSAGLGSSLETMWFDVVVRASGGICSGHMWLYYDVTSVHDFLKGIAGGAYDVAAGSKGAAYALKDGDSFYTVTIPATADGAIAAGSWMPPKPIGASTSTWDADNGSTYNQSDLTAPGGTGSVTNDLSDFSSLGPTADGRTRPDIVTPGEPIVSTKPDGVSVSSSITVGGTHFKDQGTSMASPHAAGIVALLLERNNTLGVEQVRTALAQGAHTDGMTSKTTDPANSYGPGKVEAADVLASVSVDTSAYHGTGDLDPPDSGSGCSLSRGHMVITGSALILASCAVLLCARRSRRRET